MSSELMTEDKIKKLSYFINYTEGSRERRNLPVHNIFVEFIILFRIFWSSHFWVQVTQTHTSNINTRPDRYCGE